MISPPSQNVLLSIGGLNAFFVVVAVLSAVFLYRNYWRYKKRNDSTAGSVSSDSTRESTSFLIANFLLAMALFFGLVGLVAVNGGFFYHLIGGKTFLGVNDSLGDEGFVGLLALVLGIPVALAGSVYAVMLANQSRELSARSIEYSKKERRDRQLEEWDAEMRTITTNFMDLSNVLQQMNALATSDMEQLLKKFSEVGTRPDEYDDAVALIERHDSTSVMRDSFLQLLNSARRIHSHQGSAKLLEGMIASRSEVIGPASEGSRAKRLLASHVLERNELAKESNNGQGIFVTPSDSERLGYASLQPTEDGRADALMDCLSILQIQTHRVTPRDMVRETLLMSVQYSVRAMLEGEEILLPQGDQITGLFFSEFFSQPARKRIPQYYIFYWLRMVLDLDVKFELNQKEQRRVLPLAVIVVADLHHLIPAMSEVQEFLTNESGNPSWDEIGRDALDARIRNIEYPVHSPISSISKEWLKMFKFPAGKNADWEVLRRDYDLHATDLEEALREGASKYSIVWRRIFSDIAKQFLETELATFKPSPDRIKKAVLAVKSLRDLALSEACDFKVLWWTLQARMALLEGRDTDAGTAYSEAIELQKQISGVTPERRIGFLLEAGGVMQVQHLIDEELSSQDEGVDWVEVVRCWYEAQLSLEDPIIVDGVFVTPAEVAGSEWFFPIILWKVLPLCDRKTKFVYDKKSLIDYLACSDRADKLPFDPSKVRDVFKEVHAGLPTSKNIIGDGDAHSSQPVREMDPLYQEWRRIVAEPLFRSCVVPNASPESPGVATAAV